MSPEGCQAGEERESSQENESKSDGIIRLEEENKAEAVYIAYLGVWLSECSGWMSGCVCACACVCCK